MNAALGWPALMRVIEEHMPDIEELPDDAITPDRTDPLPNDEPVKNDPVPEDDATTAPVETEKET